MLKPVLSDRISNLIKWYRCATIFDLTVF